MTPEQKIKWLAIIQTGWEANVTADNVDEYYAEIEEAGEHWEILDEIREGAFETGLPCASSRHYENKAVASELPDGTWVGWTYWFGGGKHGEPDAIEWMKQAYHLNCKATEQITVVRKFSKQ